MKSLWSTMAALITPMRLLGLGWTSWSSMIAVWAKERRFNQVSPRHAATCCSSLTPTFRLRPGEALVLIEPLLRREADMAIAKLPLPGAKAGFGLVKGLACRGIHRLSGYKTEAPLSGQRAVRADRLRELGGFARGFGVEVALTIDAARHGLRIVELNVPITHRETGRDWHGFVHRGRQFAAVSFTLLTRWKERKRLWFSSDRSSI